VQRGILAERLGFLFPRSNLVCARAVIRNADACIKWVFLGTPQLTLYIYCTAAPMYENVVCGCEIELCAQGMKEQGRKTAKVSHRAVADPRVVKLALRTDFIENKGGECIWVDEGPFLLCRA
jgi:hypothetical protein